MRKIFATFLLLLLAPVARAQSPAASIDPRIVAPDLVAPHPSVHSTIAPVAAPDRPEIAIAGDQFVIGGIRVAGARFLHPADFAPVIMSWIGKSATDNDLQAIATSIAEVARARGFLFARAAVPAQSLQSGLLVVQLDEGRVDQVRIEGGEHLGLERFFSPLANGRPVTRRMLEAALLGAGDMPGVSVGSVRLRRDGDRNILIVPVRCRRISGRTVIDNRGTRLIGPVRVQLSVDFAGLALPRDELSIGGAITAIQPREFRLVTGRYAIHPDSAGTEIALTGYYARTAAGGAYRALGIGGENYEAAIEIRRPLERTRAASLWLDGGFAVRRSNLDAPGLPLRRDRVSALTLGIEGAGIIGGGALRATSRMTIGLGLFDASVRADPDSSNPDGSGRFVAWNGQVNWTRPLDRTFALRLAGEAQYATRPLLIGEKFAIGGARLLRGYDYGERLGDNGAAASAELSAKLPHIAAPVKRAEIYGFIDGGKVSDRHSTYHAALASAGGGLRTGIGPFTAGAELAVPLTGPRYDSGNRAPRLSVTLAALF